MTLFTYRFLLLLAIISTVMVCQLTCRASRANGPNMPNTVKAIETQVTTQPRGHILTNTNVWSPDGNWIVYDTRSDAAGEQFDGSTIEIVNYKTGEVREIYRSRDGAHCGVATFNPEKNQVVFILGPETPAKDWQYGPYHRQGVIVNIDQPMKAIPLDARDITPPFTPGALRGGSHVHVFDADGKWVSFTYEDHVLASLEAAQQNGAHDRNQRNVGISVSGKSVHPLHPGPRNISGSAFSVIATRTVNNPRPGSDEISRACEEGWVGTHGYLCPDGSRQRHAVAFQGTALTLTGKPIVEVYICDLPNDVTQAGDAPLAGTSTTRPSPPRGTIQRRLTHTDDRPYSGIQGPRHWLRSSPDGSRIAFLMRDDNGVVQIWTISPNGGTPTQVTHNPFDIASSFTWSPDGRAIAYIGDNSVFTANAQTGESTRLTSPTTVAEAPRPEACVFSPDGQAIAYVRQVSNQGKTFNQIFIATGALP